MALTRYGELRNQLMRQTFPSVFAPVVLRDATHNYIPIPITERLVQCIWFDQRLTAPTLRTSDDRPIQIIFPGWWNLEAGPDFRNATIRIGDGPEQTGDIEIHLHSGDWFQHGHQHDPLYNNVILHAVLWTSENAKLAKTQAGDTPPQIVLHHQLDSTLETLYDEIDLDAYPYGAGKHGGTCAKTIGNLPAGEIAGLLAVAGDERFIVKTRKFSRWIHRCGAEQAFYEGWMEALGYKANKTAFRTLAQSVPLAEAVQQRGAALPALLFGMANFLPTVAGSDPYVQRLWRAWWKPRPDRADSVVPKTAWRHTGIRPANHPHRRLGAAVALLHRHPDLLATMRGAVEGDGDPAKILLGVRDEYWNRHYTLGGKTQARPLELIGKERAEEIISNVLLPCLAAIAETGNDTGLYEKVKSRYDALRPVPTHSILRLATQQLLGSGRLAREVLTTARQQQGLIQIFQDFCLNDKSACRKCQFPELAWRWTTPAS
jgi:hypothetical protein